jgi:hypothetical protein
MNNEENIHTKFIIIVKKKERKEREHFVSVCVGFNIYFRSILIIM